MTSITLPILTHGGGNEGIIDNANNETRSGTLTHLIDQHTLPREELLITHSAADGFMSSGAEQLRNQGSRLQSSRFICLRCCGNFLTCLVRLRRTPEEQEQRCKSKEIDRFLEKERHTFRRQVSK